MKILITGGAGFIGCNFVRHMLKEHPDKKIVVLDKLTYAGRLENLEEIKDRIEFVKGDICDKKVVEQAMKDCDQIVNFAAESHVDRSITSPEDFVRTDVLGVFTLLEEARRRDIKRFVQISTDEVYGSTVSGSFSELDNLDPSSPYSASKAGGELLARSYVRTYGMNVVVTRSSNNYGPFQYPEKLIPVLIIKALNDQPLPIYGKGLNVRDWLHVEDNCRAIDVVLQKGKAGDVVNIGSSNEVPNIEVAKMILKYMNKPESLITYVTDRPGHDFRYSLTWERIKEMGWSPKFKFDDGLRETVEWYLDNKSWWEPLIQ
ncbi:MAG: dTDP-glucose 4,6-dehydratase [Candidatus Thermoplasmatota archaeon]|nr:dTDP-glucose 4,6-dehydratase [Candidatus Thermoplasmatota archaeon]